MAQPAAALAVAAGLLVLVTVVADIFITVLHHWGGLGPLGGPVVHGGWRVMVRAIRRVRHPLRRRILGYAGPMLIPFTLFLWASLTIVGFALLYVALMPGAFHFASAVRHGTFADALYFSGVTFCTIGFGDVVPLTRTARVIAVLEGLSGLALVSLAISYFASVYTAYSSQKMLAETLHAQAGESADAARMIANHVAGGAAQSVLPTEMARLRDGMANIGSGYANWPVLHFFVAAQPRESLLRLMFMVHELSSLLDTAVDPARCPALAGLGRRSGLEATARNLRRSLAATLLLGWDRAAASAEREMREGDPALWAQRYDRAREVLREAGVPVAQDDEGRRAYVEARAEWEAWLRASAEVLGEPWADVTGEREGAQG